MYEGLTDGNQTLGAEHAMEFTHIRLEGSAPEMFIRWWTNVSLIDFIWSKNSVAGFGILNLSQEFCLLQSIDK